MRYLPLLLVIAGCVQRGQNAQADDKPKETYTQAVARFEAEVASVNATLGNQTAELEGIKEELKAVKSSVKKIEGMLSADTEISLPVPKAVDAPPVEQADQRITLHGKPLNVASVIKANYRVRWTHPGTIDSHLAEHGVAGFEGLDNETKEKLHSSLHEMGESPQKPVKAVVKQKAIVSLPMASGGCPNGRCPNAQQSWTYFSRSRRR